MGLVNRNKQIHRKGNRKRIKWNKDVDRIRKQRKQTIQKSQMKRGERKKKQTQIKKE